MLRSCSVQGKDRFFICLGLGVIIGRVLTWSAAMNPLQCRRILNTPEETLMSEETRQDAVADAFASIAIIALVVGTVTFWLASMPK